MPRPTFDPLTTSPFPSANALRTAVSGLVPFRLAFDALFEQRGRLLQLECALPTLALIPERLVRREAVGQPFELVVDCVSTSVNFELKMLIGEQLTVRTLQPDGRYLPCHGYVFEADQLGADGGLARYRLVMRPWTGFLALRRDAFLWQDKTALAVIEDLLDDYPQANYRLEVSEPLRVRSLCTQYRESDLDFITRLLAEEGLTTRFEHLGGDAATAADDQAQARHVLVISDRIASRLDLGVVRFTSQHPVANVFGQRDAVTAFATARALQPNAVVLGSWNYKHLAGTSASDASGLDLGELPTLALYAGSGAYRFESSAHAERAASLALQAVELDVKRFEGQSSARHFQAGSTFTLVDHPLYGANTTALNYAGALLASHARTDNAFTLLAVEHHATNNLGAQAAELLGATELAHGTYRNHFYCAPAAAPVVPRFVRKPTAPGVQTALVVGLADEALTTEREHRVRVQFPWQRGMRPLPSGLGHDSSSADETGNAPGSETSGTWVRVALPSAGANWGAVLVPRIGTEVLVGFVEGDVDRPVILGQLYNGQDLPPFSAGVDSGVNHPGVLSGMHTHHLDQAGFNQWVLDDATGQLRMRMLASYAQAELGLGHLIAQGAGSANRGSWRGTGFEATTQGWASLRAAKGVLVTTSERAGTYGSAQGTQMEATEALAQLRAARDLGERLSDVAKTSTAHPLTSFEARASVDQLADAIDPKKLGKHEGSVNGQQALKAGLDGRALGSDPVEAFAKPFVVLDTPSTAAFTSEAGIAGFSGMDLSVAARGDLQQTAGATYASVSGQTTSLYTHKGGIKVFAANGPVNLRAHTDELKILADQDVTVISVDDVISIGASTKIELIAGQSSVVFEGENITFTTPGKFEAKFSAHAFLGAGGAAAELEPLPVGLASFKPPANPLFIKYDEQVVFKDNLAEAIEGRLRFVVSNKAEAAQRLKGTSPPKGETARLDTPSGQPLENVLRYARFKFDN